MRLWGLNIISPPVMVLSFNPFGRDFREGLAPSWQIGIGKSVGDSLLSGKQMHLFVWSIKVTAVRLNQHPNIFCFPFFSCFAFALCTFSSSRSIGRSNRHHQRDARGAGRHSSHQTCHSEKRISSASAQTSRASHVQLRKKTTNIYRGRRAETTRGRAGDVVNATQKLFVETGPRILTGVKLREAR